MSHLFKLGVRGAKRLSGFAVSVVLQAVASFVLVPAIIGAAGLHTWSSIVLAQALAQIVATLTALGYPVTGPAVVATQTFDEAVSYFRVAERARFVVGVPCFALMIAAMFIIPNPDPIAGLLGGAPWALGAFSATFFYIGRAAPLWLLVAETVPRAALMFAGAISLALGAPLLIGLGLPVLGAVLAIAISYFSIRLSVRRTTSVSERPKTTSIRAELRNQLGPMASSVLRGGRDALPVLVVTAAAQELLGAYGVFDRLARQASNALSPLGSTLQGWVPRKIAAEGNARAAVAAMIAGFSAAATLVLFFTWLGPPLIKWVSASTLNPTLVQTFLFSVVIAASMLIQIIDYACLVPLWGIRPVIVNNLVGAVVVLISIPVMMSIERSVAYALGGVVTGLAIQLSVQVLLMRYCIVTKAGKI